MNEILHENSDEQVDHSSSNSDNAGQGE